MKKYRIEISSVAEAEADKAFLRLSQVASPTKATQWYAGLLKAIESLIQMPKRCLLARENDYFSQEIRQLLYGRGRNSYRILIYYFRKSRCINGTDSPYSTCITAGSW